MSGITVPPSTQAATEYFQAWAAKVQPGTEMIFSKIKCALADGSCGCPKDSTLYTCTGPYPPVSLEILKDVLEKGVEGVELVWYPAPEAVIADGHVHFVEKKGPHSPYTGGPAMAMYVKKIA